MAVSSVVTRVTQIWFSHPFVLSLSKDARRGRSCFDKLSTNGLARFAGVVLLASYILQLSSAFASVKQEVYLRGTVASFGGYTFSESVKFTITKPGEQDLGEITVDGIYNGEYPWIMRVYTDNLNFGGVIGVGRQPIPSGMISKDGRFSIPIEIHCPNFGPNVWQPVPDINNPIYRPYQPVKEVGKEDHTECILMGIDPRNATWVAGADGLLFTQDDNLLGDTTAATPFELSLRANVLPNSVQGEYEGKIFIEIVAAP